MNIRQYYAKFVQKRNKIRMHSITCSHIWHFDLLVLIKYIIGESLVVIQQFRREWSSKMYEKTQTNALKSKGVS